MARVNGNYNDPTGRVKELFDQASNALDEHRLAAQEFSTALQQAAWERAEDARMRAVAHFEVYYDKQFEAWRRLAGIQRKD